MKIKAAKSGDIRYFTAKLKFRESFNPREVDMLTSGTVPMFVIPRSVQGRRNNRISYDISVYSTLDYYLSYILSREQFADLLLQCINVFEEMQNLYLSYQNVVLDLDKIYVLLNDRSLHFVYLPLNIKKKRKIKPKKEVSLKKFFLKLIKVANCSTLEQVEFSNSCTQYLEMTSRFVLEEFRTLIKSLIQTEENNIDVKVVPQNKPPQNIYAPPIAEDFQNQVVLQKSSAISSNATQNLEMTAYLLREKTQEKIVVSTVPFLLGSEQEVVHYWIRENKSVSRQHAEISFQNNQWVLIDKGSTNKSFVNGIALSPYSPKALNEGDSIKLSNEYFSWTLRDPDAKNEYATELLE